MGKHPHSLSRSFVGFMGRHPVSAAFGGLLAIVVGSYGLFAETWDLFGSGEPFRIYLKKKQLHLVIPLNVQEWLLVGLGFILVGLFIAILIAVGTMPQETEVNQSKTYSRSDEQERLLHLISSIKRRAEEVLSATLNGRNSDDELYSNIVFAFTSNSAFDTGLIPQIEEELIAECKTIDRRLNWPSFVALGRLCEQLNNTVNCYINGKNMSRKIDEAHAVIQTCYKIYESTDAGLPKEIAARPSLMPPSPTPDMVKPRPEPT